MLSNETMYKISEHGFKDDGVLINNITVFKLKPIDVPI